jgi:Phosphohistidine phosphatase SixA
MRTLYLLRHAKSSWKDPSQTDFERPLANRGRKACEIVARLIQDRGLEFDLVLCSTAIRARETIELVSKYAKLRTELRFDERIYEATVSQLLEIVSQLENDRKTVLLVGHNPGFEELLHVFSGADHRFPTASLAKIKLKISKWSDPFDRKASVEWVARPKELEQLD